MSTPTPMPVTIGLLSKHGAGIMALREPFFWNYKSVDYQGLIGDNPEHEEGLTKEIERHREAILNPQDYAVLPFFDESVADIAVQIIPYDQTRIKRCETFSKESCEQSELALRSLDALLYDDLPLEDRKDITLLIDAFYFVEDYVEDDGGPEE